MEAAGSLQLCVGQPSRVKAAMHAVRSFEDSVANCVLLVDTTNTFKS